MHTKEGDLSDERVLCEKRILYILVLAIKQPAPNDLMTDIASLMHAYLTEENSYGI